MVAISFVGKVTYLSIFKMELSLKSSAKENGPNASTSTPTWPSRWKRELNCLLYRIASCVAYYLCAGRADYQFLSQQTYHWSVSLALCGTNML